MYCFVFSDLLGSVVWHLILILGNFQSFFFQIFFLFISLFLLFLIFPLHAYYNSCTYLTVLEHSVLFFCHFSVFFLLFFEVSINITLGTEILSSFVCSLLISPSKAFFISVLVYFFHLCHFFGSVIEFPSFSLHCPSALSTALEPLAY